jgi:hypothetical protein
MKPARESNIVEGSLIIRSEIEVDPEIYVSRMRALIDIIQERGEDYMEPETPNHVLDILKDMLPTPEQARKMFNTPL